jgi:hypothetical protein
MNASDFMMGRKMSYYQPLSITLMFWQKNDNNDILNIILSFLFVHFRRQFLYQKYSSNSNAQQKGSAVPRGRTGSRSLAPTSSRRKRFTYLVSSFSQRVTGMLYTNYVTPFFYLMCRKARSSSF